MTESTPISKNITQGPSRAGARAMYRAAGFDAEALRKPLIGIANTWTELGPCNFGLRGLAEHVKAGIRQAGGTPLEFNTVVISDGITMGTEGMKTSLISREVIADSMELVVRGHMLDGFVALTGCDKTTPGAIMAMCRLDIPSVLLYGGSIMPGRHDQVDITIQDVYEAIGAHATGRIDDDQLRLIEENACPGAGSCGGQFTANTMATAAEILGVALMGSGSVPATDPRKEAVGTQVGALAVELVSQNRTPSQIITRPALDNAIRSIATTGGSTNGVLHFLAIAREAGLELDIEDFQTLSSSTPLMVDLKPGGRFVAPDLDKAGGIALVARRLKEAGLLHEDALTVSGRTVGQEADRAVETPDQQVVVPVDKPLKKSGGLVILKGNLAPEGAVVKLAGHERAQHQGPARVFDSEDEVMPAIEQGHIQPGDVVVIRYEGPKGGPGYARDASRHRCHRGSRSRRLRGPSHRWPLLGCHPRPDDRPRRARSRSGRPLGRPARRRYHHHRHHGRPVGRSIRRNRVAGPPSRLGGPTAALHLRRDGQIRPLGVVGSSRGGDQLIVGEGRFFAAAIAILND